MDTTMTKIQTYLSFILAEEIFAVEVSKVREVLEFPKITKIPKTPVYMIGVINLRGSVVPVIDLKLKFGIEKTESTIDTCIIVMEISLDNEIIIIGSMADSVQEVFEIDPGNIEPPPNIGIKLNTEFISGMGKRDDRFMIILDIDKVFTEKDIHTIKKSSEGFSDTET